MCNLIQCLAFPLHMYKMSNSQAMNVFSSALELILLVLFLFSLLLVFCVRSPVRWNFFVLLHNRCEFIFVLSFFGIHLQYDFSCELAKRGQETQNENWKQTQKVDELAIVQRKQFFNLFLLLQCAAF